MTIYHMIIWFFMFSLMGYLLECMVLSVEHKTPVINRGFCHVPFCIIYGFGAVGASVLLRPFADQAVKLYFGAMFMATAMELVTAIMMIRLFGSFWWDYSHKPFNYKGIICLESSLAWGFLGIFFFRFLNGFIHHLVGYVPDHYVKRLALGLVTIYLLDFVFSAYEQLKERQGEEGVRIIGRLKLY